MKMNKRPDITTEFMLFLSDYLSKIIKFSPEEIMDLMWEGMNEFIKVKAIEEEIIKTERKLGWFYPMSKSKNKPPATAIPSNGKRVNENPD